MAHAPDLAAQDIVVLNTSGGKDSQVMIEVVTERLRASGFTGWVVAAHADLGEVEWAGTKSLAQEQATFYGVTDFRVVARTEGLLAQVGSRRVSLDKQAGKLFAEAAECDDADEAEVLLAKAVAKESAPAWPSSDARYCTSDQKTSQVTKLITSLVADWQAIHGPAPVRVLNCLGIRAQESPARAKKVAYGFDAANWSGTKEIDGKKVKVQHGKRIVVRWLPIFDMTEAEVWDRIRTSGAPYHRAYDLGMTRLSCVFCVFASKSDLLIAAKNNPELARKYAAVEITVRSRFTDARSMADIIAEAGI